MNPNEDLSGWTDTMITAKIIALEDEIDSAYKQYIERCNKLDEQIGHLKNELRRREKGTGRIQSLQA